jgi:hypothetical protein
MFDWLWKNREWVFSGVGVAAVVGIVAWFRNKGRSGSRIKQSQRSGHNATNIQSGRDINIGGGKGGR